MDCPEKPKHFNIPSVKQRLGIGTPLAEATPEEILELVFGGAVIELDKGWRLTTARIAGDEVVELALNGVPANRNELVGYGFSEEILHFKRRWFVLPDEAGEVLSRLLSQHKPVRDVTAADPQDRSRTQ